MTTYTVESVLHRSATGRVDLGDRTWEDVADWYVKWDTLHVKFKDEDEWVGFELCSDAVDTIDWKHPMSVNVYEENEEGVPDYSTAIAEI